MNIPDDFQRLWMAKHPTHGLYVVERWYRRDERFNPCARRWQCSALYRIPAGFIVAVAAFPDIREPNGRRHKAILSLGGIDTDGWEVETDEQRNTREPCRCAFCDRTVMVRPYNRRARDLCPCGARHFMRKVFRSQQVIGEEEGWRLGTQEIIRL